MVSDQHRPVAKGHAQHGLAALPDDELVERVAQGEQAAYGLLVVRYADRHISMAERVMGNRAEAEDAVQEAFVKLWTNARQYDASKARFSTWFYRIVLNQCLDRKRRKAPVEMPEGFDVADDRDGQDDLIVAQQRQHRIKAALDELPERQKTAIVLCYLEGMSNKEAADLLDVGVKALESLLTRGRKAMAGALADEANELLDLP